MTKHTESHCMTRQAIPMSALLSLQ